MKRRTKSAALIVSTTILAGACLVSARLQRPYEAQPVLAEEAGYDLSIGTQKEMTALSWAYEGETVNLVRNTQGRWENADDPSCPIDNNAAGRLARAAAAVTASMAVDGVVDFSQYGLDAPALTVMAAAGDRIVRYELGLMALTGEYYLRMDGGTTVYLENDGLYDAFSADLTSLLAAETLPKDIEAVTGLTVKTEAESYSVSISPGGVWRRGDGETLEEGAVSAFLDPVLETELSDCVDWRTEGYGFDTPQGVVTLSYIDEDGRAGSFTLEYGDYDERSVYTRLAGSELVYRVSAAVLDRLMYPDWESMTTLVVPDIDPAGIAALDIDLEGERYEILRLTEDGEAIYSMSGWVLEAGRVEGFLKKLSALSAERTVSAKEGRSEMFSLTLTGTDGEETGLSLWQYDSAHALYAAGEKSYLVQRQDAQELTRTLSELVGGE